MTWCSKMENPLEVSKSFFFVDKTKKDWMSVCLRAFDKGASRIYVVNDEQRFQGKMVTRESFRKGCLEGNFFQECIAGELNEMKIESALLASWYASLKQVNTEQDEFLLTRKDRPYGVLLKKEIEQAAESQALDIRADCFGSIRVFCFRHHYNRIYLSSLASESAIRFYRTFAPMLPIRILDSEHLQDALHTPNALLIYATDVFPYDEGERILSFGVFWRKIEEMRADLLGLHDAPPHVPGDGIYLDKKIVSVTDDYHGIQRFVSAFDAGEHQVYRVDHEGMVNGFLHISQFRNQFFSQPLEMHPSPCVAWEDNDQVVKAEAEKKMQESGMEEIPLVREGRLAGRARRWAKPRDHRFVRWSMISKQVFADYIGLGGGTFSFPQKREIFPGSVNISENGQR